MIYFLKGFALERFIILCVYHYTYILGNIETIQETPCNVQEKITQKSFSSISAGVVRSSVTLEDVCVRMLDM